MGTLAFGATVAENDEQFKPLAAPIIVERTYLVDGRKVTVHVTFPAKLGKEIGMENTYQCAQGILVSVESAKANVRELKRGE